MKLNSKVILVIVIIGVIIMLTSQKKETNYPSSYFSSNPNVARVFSQEVRGSTLTYYNQYIVQLEQNGNINMPISTCFSQYDANGDGVLDSDTYNALFFSCMASDSEYYFKIQAAKVAFSIWADETNKFTWKLNDYTDEQLSLILGNNRFKVTNIFDYSPVITYNLSRHLLSTNQMQTIVATFNEFRNGGSGLSGFRHGVHGVDDYTHTYGTYEHMATYMPTLSYPYQDVHERVSLDGCITMSPFVTDTLLSLNIPAFTNFGLYYNSHNSVFMPGYGILFHGDDIYDSATTSTPIMSYSYFNEHFVPCLNGAGVNAYDDNNLAEWNQSCIATQSVIWDAYRTGTCTDSCYAHGYTCGTWTICGVSQSCGSCSGGQTCNSGTCTGGGNTCQMSGDSNHDCTINISEVMSLAKNYMNGQGATITQVMAAAKVYMNGGTYT